MKCPSCETEMVELSDGVFKCAACNVKVEKEKPEASFDKPKKNFIDDVAEAAAAKLRADKEKEKAEDDKKSGLPNFFA